MSKEKSLFEKCLTYVESNECATQTLEEAFSEAILGLRLTDRQRTLLYRILENLDEQGYLKESTENIRMYCLTWCGEQYTEDEITKAVKLFRSLDLYGLGASSLQECLLMQLCHFGTSDNVKLTQTIVSKYFEELKYHRHEYIAQRLGIQVDRVRKCVSILRRCTANPAKQFAGYTSYELNQTILPDFQVVSNNDKLSIELVSELETTDSEQETEEYQDNGTIKETKASADTMSEFRRKMLLVASEILKIQKEYFLSGDRCLLIPMSENEIAERTGVTLSCVNRIVQKYTDTNFGLVQLKTIFTQAIPNTQLVSADAKERVKEIIESEDKHKPLTDQEIADKLNALGYTIGRRTIVKYREQLGYLVARLRKK